MSTSSPPHRRMQHEYHKVPVTALAFLTNEILLAGEGNYLTAYNASSDTAISTVRIFGSQQIHGIVVDRDIGLALIYGGRLIRAALVTHYGNARIRFNLSHASQAEDWILDAAFAPPSSEDCPATAGLVTAHNALIICSIALAAADGGIPTIELERVVADSNCILYSAHILWLSSSQCLIASGTAFGDVIVWSYSQDEGSKEVRHTFSAHEGSVFGVQISDLTLLPGHSDGKRLLASCSDDRTVRLWDITDLELGSPQSAQVQRKTGFSPNASPSADMDAQAPPCVASVMGHISRVWHVRFFAPYEEHSKQQNDRDTGIRKATFRVISFGEDATAITWSSKPATADSGMLPFMLERESIISAHAGKNIWSVAIDNDRQVATGGADGAIVVSNLGPVDSSNMVEIPSSLLSEPDQQELETTAKDTYRSYALVSSNDLIAITNSGRVVHIGLVEGAEGKFTVQEFTQQHKPHIRDSLAGFSVMTSMDGIAYASGRDGNTYSFDPDHGHRSNYDGSNMKTAGLFMSQIPKGYSADASGVPTDGVTRTAFLRTSVASRTVRGWEMGFWRRANRPPFNTGSAKFVQFDVPDDFVVTSFAHLGTFRALGSRNGCVALMSTTSGEEDSVPEHKMLHVHGKETATALLWRQIAQPEDSGASVCRKGHLYSTSRDGTLAVHAIKLSEEDVKAELVHQLALPFGPNIEGLCYTPKSHLWVWGFRSKQFVVYDVTSQHEIMSVECGGARRNWTFRPAFRSAESIDGEGGTFVWTQAAKVYWYTQVKLPCTVINSGGHGREIKALAVSQAEPQLVATGAEDTDIKLWCYNSGSGFTCLQTLRKHNTGIQHLQWSADGRYLFSSGGFEESFVWRVSHGVPGVGVAAFCESTFPNAGKSDLRIMGFDVIPSREEAGGLADGKFEIAMAYSDSTVKKWSYRAGDWMLLATGDYLTACLTHAIYPSSGCELLITAGTDGHLAAWDPRLAEHAVVDRQGSVDSKSKSKASSLFDALVWTKRHKVHQNAILSATENTLPDGSSFIVTGGDDNALGFTRWRAGCSPASLLIPRAHAAAVTAITVTPSDEAMFLVVTASIDQRVKLWRVDVDTNQDGAEGVKVQLLSNDFTAVADVSSMNLLRLKDGGFRVLLCGVGMDVWRFDDAVAGFALPKSGVQDSRAY